MIQKYQPIKKHIEVKVIEVHLVSTSASGIANLETMPWHWHWKDPRCEQICLATATGIL